LLVEHPRARILIDAGLPARPRGRLRSLLPASGRLWPTVPRALHEHGVRPEDVTDVVLTHMHFDHVGAVPAFSHARVLVGPGEVAPARGWRAALLGFAGSRRALAHGLAEVSLHPWDEGGRAFPLAHDLLGDGAIVLLHTPGHTRGSLSVLIRTDPPLLHIGDAAYNLETLRSGHTNGRLLGRPADADPGQSRRTLDRIQELAARLGAQVLPAHDPGAWAAL